MPKKELSPQEFLANLERKSGGTIEWKTYAFYMGKTGGSPESLGGLLYRVGDSLIFEDFESSRPLLKLSKPKPYEKTRFFIPLSSIREIRPLSAGVAKKLIRGAKLLESASPLTGLERFLFKRVNAVITEEGEAYFFELYDREGLARELGV